MPQDDGNLQLAIFLFSIAVVFAILSVSAVSGRIDVVTDLIGGGVYNIFLLVAAFSLFFFAISQVGRGSGGLK